MTEQDDLSRGYLQVASMAVTPDGLETRWGTLRAATAREATMKAAGHPVFWVDPLGEAEAYWRPEYPLRERHLPARVIPAADVWGRAELVIRTTPPQRTATVLLRKPGGAGLTSPMPFELAAPAEVAQLTAQMRAAAVAFAAGYGYSLHGIWEHHKDGAHRITADPGRLVPQP